MTLSLPLNCYGHKPRSAVTGANRARSWETGLRNEPLWLNLRVMVPEANDEQLMLAYAAGDGLAFECLYARHRGGLYRFLLRGLSNRASAEECFQEVWSRVIAARTRYRPEAKFSTWLYQIAHNLLVDQYRRKKPTDGGADMDIILASVPGDEARQPERALSEFEERRRMQIVIAELPDEQRIAIQLRLEQELSLEEIATVMGVGRETVKSRLRYAMDKLRVALKP